MKKHQVFAAASACLMLGACASVTRGTTEAWEVNSDPGGARVETSNGHACEATPCAIQMKRKSEFVATISKPGYRPAKIAVTHKTSKGGAGGMAGNILAGGIIGLGVDAATGATQDLVPNPGFAKLEVEGSPAGSIQLSTLDWSKAVGKNTIKGSAFLRTRGGEVRTCAGLQARLIPSGASTDTFIHRAYGSISGGLVQRTTWAAQPFDDVSRATTCDIRGEFEFTDLPDGRYYVTVVVSWEAIGGYSPHLEQQGGTIATPVTLAGGETRSIVVTH